MMEKEPYYILGLDPGIASCGFALIDIANHRILEMGSHLFDVPQDKRQKVSFAKKRRDARSSRRNNKRTKDRQKHCLNLLKKYSLVPIDATKESMQSRKGDKLIMDLRKDALDRVLSDREFAQILYSLSGHRGYFPNGEGDGKDSDEETGKVLSALAQNDKEMKEAGCRTIGEYLYQIGRSRNKTGSYDFCVKNSQIISEIRTIFEIQRSLGNNKALKALEDEYIGVMTWRAVNLDYDKRIYSKVGACSYFPTEKRAAKADLSFELCQAYEKLGHIMMVDADGEETPLTKAQIQNYITRLFSIKPTSVKYSKIRHDLDLPATTYFKGVEKDEENKIAIVDAKAWNLLVKKLPESLLPKMLDDLQFSDEITEALTYASSEASLLDQLQKLDLTEEERNAVMLLPYSSKSFKGYGNRSRKALYMLIDAFKDNDVRTLTDAEEASGLLALRFDQNKKERTKLLMPYELYDPTCTNPVVLRALSRMRRIVNAIIKIYGVPHEIHIEVGRELKQSNREKKLINKRNKQNQQNHRIWAQTIAGIRGCLPEQVTKKDLLKYELREQQNQKDAYTGEPIDLEQMILNEHYCEIDHILPYSRTGENSKENKVLVLGASNQNKRERTPYEWMMQSAETNTPSWENFKVRTLANDKYSRRKKEYLLNTKLDQQAESKFIERNFNDTRYMSIAIKNYLEDTLLFPENSPKTHVLAVSGGATALLRHSWGLNFGENATKDRTDDRHHAVDACVIAACSFSAVKKIAQAHARGQISFEKTHVSRLADTQPWETFAEDVVKHRETVVPTRFVDHGVTGRAFEETNYRFDGFSNDSRKIGLLYGNKQAKTSGNICVDKDSKSAHIVDKMAFLRLWLDPLAKNGKGKWYAEPVYYADIPTIRNGSYVPKALKSKVARVSCEELPKEAQMLPPIVLFANDVVEVDGVRARYMSININSVSIEYASLTVDNNIGNMPTFGKWNKETKVKVIQEDCLGHCYKN